MFASRLEKEAGQDVKKQVWRAYQLALHVIRRPEKRCSPLVFSNANPNALRSSFPYTFRPDVPFSLEAGYIEPSFAH